jgi:hypothetical protein
MFEVILLVALPVAILIAYLLGHSRGYNTADQFAATDTDETPIYNQMALDYPEVFMWMKSERL